MLSQKKLADLYLSKGQEMTAHNRELEDLVKDLESRLFNLSEEREALDTESKETIADLKTQLQNQELEIEKLNSELKNINSEIINQNTSHQIGQLSETAAANSLLKKAGKSVTQVYSDYTKLQQELIKEKSEVSRLQECLNHIVSEFELRAPLIQKTNEDYQRSKEQFQKLSVELSVAVREKNDAVNQSKLTQASLKAAETEQKLLQKDVQDLGRQVQALLREQHLLKGGHVSSLPNEPDSDYDQSGADAIISKRLVVFKNIEELQSQNQSLLRSIRSLSAKMEAEELRSHTEADDAKVQALNESTKLIEQLQDRLKREVLNSESYVRERDQWRRIAETRGSKPDPIAPHSPAKSVNGTDFETPYRELQVLSVN